ncbi:hypothetical protein, conserved [Eimeria tenella]|uniref:Uncharacterized protein n=1 Tax=Eimeria tenella TaxID=5802 RepID=U6KU75_EIMTE|nr:hypothetical protein, conserved [Eimeria tenella]CDJ41501.1 hypothetical protein, conserved [Eimeria tenella]|eukprot:XP_013232251.1 hypothetical protein, conserved [Eimeria tenella]
MFRVAAWAAGRHKLFCSHTRPLKKALAPYSCRSYSGRYPAAVLSSTAAEAPALRGQEASALHCYSPRASSSSGSSNSSSGNTGTSNRGSDSRVRYDVNRSVTIRVNSSRSSSSSSSFRMEEESFGPFAPRFFSCTVSKNCNHFATSRSYVAQSSNGSSSYCSDSGKSTGNDSSSSSRSSNSNKGSSWRSRQSSDRDTSDDNNCSEEQSSSSDSSTSSSISSNMSRVMSEEIFLGAKIRQQNLCKRVPFRVHRTGEQQQQQHHEEHQRQPLLQKQQLLLSLQEEYFHKL